MGLCVGIYYLLFLEVFDGDPGAVISKIALFFFISSFALLPWLFCFYSGYCRYIVRWGLSAGMLLSYIILLFTFEFAQPVIWNISAHLVLIGIMAFGYKAANYQRKNQDVLAAWLMIAALIILTLLTIDDIFSVHLNEFYPFSFSDEIFPLDYFLVLFMIIMGLKLAGDIQQEYILERSVNRQERRW